MKEIQKHLRIKDFNSFRKLLSKYDFRQLFDQPNQFLFTHPFFKRGERELASKIERKRQTLMHSRFVVNPFLITSNQALINTITAIKNRNSVKSIIELLKHVKSLKKVPDCGLVKFMKDLEDILVWAFPGTRALFSQRNISLIDITDQANSQTSFEFENIKELLINLINQILIEMKKQLEREIQSIEETKSNLGQVEQQERKNDLDMEEPEMDA